jgi:hypothetical protein
MFDKFKLTLSLLFAGLVFGHLNAQEEYITSDEDVAVSEASEPEVVDASLMVEDMIDEYLNHGKGKAIRNKVQRDGGWIGYSYAAVNTTPENPNWAKFRVLAYDKALVNVENEYLQMQNQNIKAAKIRQIYQNANAEVPDFKPEEMSDSSKVNRLLNKLFAVTEGKLDKALDELGVDKEQFAEAPEKQRHVMFGESLTKATIVESIGSLSGMIPIQTFEGFNERKEHVIGVVCIVTPKLKQFAYDVLHSRGYIEPTGKVGEDLYEKFSSEKSLLVDQFGVRKMIDKEGSPVLISFGQWANNHKTSNATLKTKYREVAKKQAAAQAKNQIAIFLAGKSMYQSESQVGELFEDAYNVSEDNYKEEDLTNTILDGLNETSQTKANVNMTGLVPLYTWTLKHPQYGHEIVGAIYKWSPKDEMAARKLKNWKPNSNPKPHVAPKPKEEIKGENGSKQGQDYMDLDDF